MVSEIMISGNITMYYRDSFIGRDSGEDDRRSWGSAWGLTNWIAESFELLDLGEPPFGDNRKVDGGNRAEWTEFTNLYLERLFPNQPIRICFRKTMNYVNRYSKTEVEQ